MTWQWETLLLKAESLGYNKNAYRGSFESHLMGTHLSKRELIEICNRRLNKGAKMPWSLAYADTLEGKDD